MSYEKQIPQQLAIQLDLLGVREQVKSLSLKRTCVSMLHGNLSMMGKSHRSNLANVNGSHKLSYYRKS